VVTDDDGLPSPPHTHKKRDDPNLHSNNNNNNTRNTGDLVCTENKSDDRHAKHLGKKKGKNIEKSG
jgi:hypothetical protein